MKKQIIMGGIMVLVFVAGYFCGRQLAPRMTQIESVWPQVAASADDFTDGWK